MGRRGRRKTAKDRFYLVNKREMETNGEGRDWLGMLMGDQ